MTINLAENMKTSAAPKKQKVIQSATTTTITTFTDGTEAKSIREDYTGQTLTEIDLHMAKRSKELGYPVKSVNVYHLYGPAKGLQANITFETGSYYEGDEFDG